MSYDAKEGGTKIPSGGLEPFVRWLLSRWPLPDFESLTGEEKHQVALWLRPLQGSALGHTESRSPSSNSEEHILRRQYKHVCDALYGLSRDDPFKVNFQISFIARVEKGGALSIETTAAPGEKLQHEIYKHLITLKDRIRRCAASGCNHLFIRRKRQRYCSTRCASRHRGQKHRLGASGVHLPSSRLKPWERK